MTEQPVVDRALSFGAAAEEYDTYRPRYPDQLVDDVAAMVPGRQVVEVGAGTVIATAAFVARGLAMTCIEPDALMSAVLLRKLTDAAELHVDVATFEAWSAARTTGAPAFDALISAQAWHWTDPQTRWGHAAAAVRGGGLIALFWNEDHFADPRVLETMRAAYERHGIDMPWPIHTETAPVSEPAGAMAYDHPDGWPEGLAGAELHFHHPRLHRYEWRRRVTVTDYLAHLNTTSAHRILQPGVRDSMTTELIAALTTYSANVELAMRTSLITAVRRG